MLEVLISMFVLLIGLVGVSALLPAGKFEILQGVKTDYATMIGRSAFRDLKTRGYLNPTGWPVGTAGTPVALDPLGLAAGFTAIFPTGPTLTRIVPSAQVNSAALADPVFRCSDDLILTPNANKDLPPAQQMIPIGAAPLKRASVGNYSWLATVVPDPTIVPAISGKMTVSVAVFYKRDLSTPGESTATATVNGGGIGGGEVTLSSFLPGPPKPVKPGQWIMLAYAVGTYNYFRWYRVVAADIIDPTTNNQAATLAGPDIPSATATAWIIDNVIGVYEKNLRLEVN